MSALAIPQIGAARPYCSPLKRHLIGAVRYDFEVRLHSIADIKAMYRGLLSPAQVDGILHAGSFPEIPARMCSLSWLLKQKEKQS